ncbi:MAG TPA: hypothetical protein VK056_00010 [Bacillota bacterium]|nr:hypothetical protein [Bacillota bacterium]
MTLETVNIYLFVSAALLAVISVVVIFKVLSNRLKDNPETYNQVQKNLFIGVAMSKIVPVIILIFAILRMPSGVAIDRLLIPWALIILVVVVSFIYISGQKKLNLNPHAQRAVNTLVTITRPHLFSIPVMAIVFLFLMTL